MCGIVGWVSPAPAVDRGTLARMADVLAHRGPDGRGVYVSGDSRVGLGHRRLSIIDLSPAASQPMQDPTGRATLVFNGEIYNHAKLRRELERSGRPFRTDHSDTETVLQAYLHWGLPDMLSRLIGIRDGRSGSRSLRRTAPAPAAPRRVRARCAPSPVLPRRTCRGI